MFLSVFDLFKIAIGPSSSHTMGPMTVAGRVLSELANAERSRAQVASAHHLKVILHGSLAFTGIGHASDRAAILGLAGYRPDTVDPDEMDTIIAKVRETCSGHPSGYRLFFFDPEADVILDRRIPLPGHANGMAFEAYDTQGRLVFGKEYFSIGGGFVVDQRELSQTRVGESPYAIPDVPFPFSTAAEMLAMATASGRSIAEIERANELAEMSEELLNAGFDAIWRVITIASIVVSGRRGCSLAA